MHVPLSLGAIVHFSLHSTQLNRLQRAFEGNSSCAAKRIFVNKSYKAHKHPNLINVACINMLALIYTDKAQKTGSKTLKKQLK